MISIMQRLTITVFAAFLSSCAVLSPQAATELPEIDIPYTKYVLDNGLRLIVHEDRKTPIVAVNVWYHVGSKNETPGRTGFAHLFEHLMFNGSENYNDEFFRPLEAAGATGMNGTTNADRTNYFANVPTPSLDLLLWLESDRMGHMLGAVDQAKLDEQRGVVQNEKRQGENRPYGKIWSLMPKYSYPATHPYSWSTIGSMEDLDAASLEDVSSFFKTWYGAANAVVVVAGDISPEEAKAKVEHYFGDIPAGPALDRPKQWPAPMELDRRVALTDQVPQARSYLVWNVAPNFSQDLIHLQLAADILANGKNSRLYKRLVYTEQSATQVGAFLIPRELGSQFVVVLTAKEGHDIRALEQAAEEEINTLLKDGPNAAELSRVQTANYLGLIRGLERVGGFGGKSDILASGEIYTGRPDAYAEELQWLKQANADDVQDSLKSWLSYGNLTLSVSPADKHSTSSVHADRSKLPDSGQAPDLKLPAMQRAKLSNGLEVVLAERHAAPLVEMRLLTRAGYAVDPAGQKGLANLTMSMLDEGAAGRSTLEIAESLEKIGASLSSGASLDNCTISLSAVSSLLEPALDIYSQVIQQPDFPANELERLRDQILAGITQEKASPFQMGLRVLPPLLYGENHPYSAPMTGSGYAADLQTLSREDLQRYYQQWIHPQNAQLLVVGNITMDELMPMLESRLGEWQSSDNAQQRLALPQAPIANKQRIFLIDKPGAEQSVVLAGHLAPGIRDEDELAMKMANTAFGGMFTSRINMNLREEKHWSYGARSSLITTRDQRPFVAYSRVQRDKTAPAMKEILRELNEIRGKRPIKAEELGNIVRNQTLSLPGKHETAAQVAGSLSRILNLDLPDDYYDNYVSSLREMTHTQALQGAKKLFQPKALTWVIVGDLDKIQSEIEALGWAKPELIAAE